MQKAEPTPTQHENSTTVLTSSIKKKGKKKVLFKKKKDGGRPIMLSIWRILARGLRGSHHITFSFCLPPFFTCSILISPNPINNDLILTFHLMLNSQVVATYN